MIDTSWERWAEKKWPIQEGKAYLLRLAADHMVSELEDEAEDVLYDVFHGHTSTYEEFCKCLKRHLWWDDDMIHDAVLEVINRTAIGPGERA